jgi:hypothetical protein
MADDPKTVPIFQLDPTNDTLTHLHGAEIPDGLLTVGSSIAAAKAPSPAQSDWVIEGVYEFADHFSTTKSSDV